MNEPVKLSDLKSALKRLKEAIEKATDDLDRDGTIQRFEFTFELAWKTTQEYVKYKGLETASPRDTFRVAADLNLIENPQIWFEFLKDRNDTTHLYNDKRAQEIFAHIPNFVSETEKLISNLSQE